MRETTKASLSLWREGRLCPTSAGLQRPAILCRDNSARLLPLKIKLPEARYRVRGKGESKGDRHPSENDGHLGLLSISRTSTKPLASSRSYGAAGSQPSRHRQPVLLTAHESLYVVIQENLIGMRPKAHRVDFLGPLVADPGFDQILRKHLTLEEKLLVLL